MTRMAKEDIRKGNPDDFYEYLREHSSDSRTRENSQQQKACTYFSKPETIFSDFKEMYQTHYDELHKRITYIQNKAIHLYGRDVIMERKEGDNNFWIDVANNSNGEAASYSPLTIDKFYDDGFETSDYKKVLFKVANAFTRYQNDFPEYFI